MKIFDGYKEDYKERFYNINHIVDNFREDIYRMIVLGIVILLPDSLLKVLSHQMSHLLPLDDKTKYTKIMEFIIIRMDEYNE